MCVVIPWLMVRVVGPVPELPWHAATADPRAHGELIDALTSGGHFREPVVLRGAADEWPAVCDSERRWTLSRLVNHHGSFEVGN